MKYIIDLCTIKHCSFLQEITIFNVLLISIFLFSCTEDLPPFEPSNKLEKLPQATLSAEWINIHPNREYYIDTCGFRYNRVDTTYFFCHDRYYDLFNNALQLKISDSTIQFISSDTMEIEPYKVRIDTVEHGGDNIQTWRYIRFPYENGGNYLNYYRFSFHDYYLDSAYRILRLNPLQHEVNPTLEFYLKIKEGE